MMLSNSNKKNINQYLNNNSVETKRAYLTLAVYLIFYISLIFFQGLLPFNQTLVGLVTLVQIFICLFLTVSVGKLRDTSSIFLYLFTLASMILSEFNRIVCESANLAIMIQMSTLIFFTLTYYRLEYYKKFQTLVLLD